MRGNLQAHRVMTLRRVAVVVTAFGTISGCISSTEPSSTLTPATLEAITPTSLTGTVGKLVSPAPTVRVKDRNGNPVPGVPVTFDLIFGGGTLESVVAHTDINGLATAAWTLGTRVETNRLTVTAEGVGSVSFAAAAAAGAPAEIRRLPVPLGLFGAAESAIGPLRVYVVDEFENRVAGETVTFAVTAGGGRIVGATATTDRDGVAGSGHWTLGDPGENSVSATVTGLAPVTFTVTVVERGGLPPVTYEMDSVRIGPTMASRIPSRIVFGENGQFTMYVEVPVEGAAPSTLEGRGNYTLFGSEIVLTYSDDFLRALGKALDYWPRYNSPNSDRGVLKGDVITLFRCWTEDCYESSWRYSRVAP